jgi:hypothetical protein
MTQERSSAAHLPCRSTSTTTTTASVSAPADRITRSSGFELERNVRVDRVDMLCARPGGMRRILPRFGVCTSVSRQASGYQTPRGLTGINVEHGCIGSLCTCANRDPPSGDGAEVANGSGATDERTPLVVGRTEPARRPDMTTRQSV